MGPNNFWIGVRAQRNASPPASAWASGRRADPKRFHGHKIDLAADNFTLPEVATKIAKAMGKPVSAITFSKEESLANPYGELDYKYESWNNVENFMVDLDASVAGVCR